MVNKYKSIILILIVLLSYNFISYKNFQKRTDKFLKRYNYIIYSEIYDITSEFRNEGLNNSYNTLNKLKKTNKDLERYYKFSKYVSGLNRHMDFNIKYIRDYYNTLESSIQNREIEKKDKDSINKITREIASFYTILDYKNQKFFNRWSNLLIEKRPTKEITKKYNEINKISKNETEKLLEK